MSQMLLSIKPQYVEKIIAGKKKFEFRKFHCREDIDTIIIYATAPTKQVIGEVSLIDIIEGDVDYVWQETRGFGGILKKDYTAYYKKREIAVAYQLGASLVMSRSMMSRRNSQISASTTFHNLLPTCKIQQPQRLDADLSQQGAYI